MMAQIEEQKNYVAEMEFVKKSYEDRVGLLYIPNSLCMRVLNFLSTLMTSLLTVSQDKS